MHERTQQAAIGSQADAHPTASESHTTTCTAAIITRMTLLLTTLARRRR